jgi:hypothetical protein
LLGGWSQPLLNLEAWQAQLPILTAHCGPEWLVMMATALLQGSGR